MERYPGYAFTSLAYNYKNRDMEPMIVTISPSDEAELMTHSGQEFNYVLEGSIKVIIKNREFILNAGDSIYFNPAFPHGAAGGHRCGEIFDDHQRVRGRQMLERFLDRIEFDSYEDFKQNYKLNIPEHFNFGYDIGETNGRGKGPKQACTARLVRATTEMRGGFSYGDMKRMSDKAANMLNSKGVRRGDPVLLMLKQRPEVWFMMVGLHKLGAVCIPATFQLTPKDIIYRCNAADVKMICAVDDEEMLKHVEASLPECKTVGHVGVVGENIPEWAFDLRAELAAADGEWTREYINENDEPMLHLFFVGNDGHA